MKYDWLDAYCLSKKGAEKDYKIEWEAIRYMIDGKMFAMQGSDNEGRTIITVKLEPAFGEFLRSQFADIRPGYYMNKIHWNSVDLNGIVPDDVLKSMLDQSHALILQSLSKKRQTEILEGK